MYKLSAIEIAKGIKNKEFSLDKVLDTFSSRIKSANPKYNAVVSLFDEPIIPENKDAEFFGVPILIKDNMCIKGKEMTCASKILKGYVAPYDAHVIAKLKKAGFVILGTANMDEFAFGSSCETSCYGPAKNPWNDEYVPGGSSGGSAASVGLGFSPVSLGSDTGGSIRQPASFCGVVGLKPTYARVSRYGLAAFGSSLDQIGPFSRYISDAAALLNVIAGKDKYDSTSSSREVEDYTKFLDADIKGIKIGIPKEFFIKGLDKEVQEKIEEVKSVLKTKGAIFEDISLPHTEYAVSVYYIIASSEASTNLSRYDGVRYGNRQKADDLLNLYKKTKKEGFGEEAKRRIMLGTFSLSSGYYDAYYLKAQKVRTLIKRDFEKVFKAYDAILTPTSPTPPFKIGEKTQDPLSMYLSDIYTISSNLAGVPAISIPCGFTENKLPVGFQLISDYFKEGTLFKIGYSYQSETTWHKEYPE